MRVSSTGMVSSYLQQLNRSYNNYTKLMEQSDGSKLHRPSDDAVAYSKYLRYSNTKGENTQYQTNVKTAISWMKNTDSAMIDVSDCLATIVEKAVQAGNDTNGQDDMTAISEEMLVMAQQAVSDANAQVGDRYLFSGQMDTTQPYVFSDEKHDRGLTKTLDEAQHNFFGTALKSDGAGEMSQMLAMKGNDGNTYYLNTTNGQFYTQDFVDSGYKDNIAQGNSKAADSDIKGTMTLYANCDRGTTKITRANTNNSTSTALKDILYYSMESDGAGGYTVKTSKEATASTLSDDGSFTITVSDGTKNCDVSFTYKEIADGATLDDLSERINEKAAAAGVAVTASYASGSDTFRIHDDNNNGTAKMTFSASDSGTTTGNLGENLTAKLGFSSGTVTASVGDYFDTNGVIKDSAKAYEFETDSTYTDENGKEQKLTLQFDTISQYIVTYQGDDKQFSMVKENGAVQPSSDTVNISGQTLTGTSLFDNDISGNAASGAAAFNDVLTVVAMTAEGNNKLVSSDGITLANNSYNTVNTAETKLAARQQVYTAVEEMLDKQATYITSDVSDVADTDVAELAVSLMSAQTIYNLALSVGARILPSSLADYL